MGSRITREPTGILQVPAWSWDSSPWMMGPRGKQSHSIQNLPLKEAEDSFLELSFSQTQVQPPVRLRQSQTTNVKNSQYATKISITATIKPSIPLPSIVKHAWITAITAAIFALCLQIEARRRMGAFSGLS